MNFRAFLRDIGRLLAPHRGLVVLVAIGLSIDVAFQTALPLSLKFLIDRAIVPADRHLLYVLLWALVAGLAFAAVAMIWRDFLYARLGSDVLRDIRRRLFTHLQSLSLDFFAVTRPGDLLSRFSGDLASVELMVVGALPNVFGALLTLLLLAIALFALNLQLAIASALLAPLCWLGPRWLLPRAAALGLEARRRDADSLSLIQENLEGQPAVKALGLEQHGIDHLQARLDDAAIAGRRFNFASYLAERLPNISMLGLHVAILVWGAHLAFDGTITIGTLVAFNAALLNLGAAVATLTSSAHTFLGAAAGLRRIREVLDQRPKVADAPGAQPIGPIRGTLRFENVAFAHGDAKVLDGLTIEIPPGSSVALVGTSGSGKSTALSLLARFHDPTEGSVTLDGTDLRAFTLASLRARTGIVQQDSFLFHGSVRDNIRLGRLDATDGEIEQAAILAEADAFIRHLPKRYGTHLGAGGARLSGGQRQRIAIARVLLRKPDLLLLDEATSALDPATERAVNATLAGLRHLHTSVRVTHRLSEAADCDRICVLEAGRVVEHGTHAALLARDGQYARLWRKQQGVTVDDNLEHAAITAAWLSEWPLFEGSNRVLLEEMSRAFVTERAAPGVVVMREGDPGDRFFIIVRGTVAVARDADGQAREVAKLADGDAFGESALMSDEPRNATVTAITDCVFLTLERSRFRRWVDRDPAWRLRLERLAAGR